MNFVDKALQPLLGTPLLEHSIRNAAAQVQQLVLSVNHNIERYREFGLPIVSDHLQNYGGPLLGILSAMYWYQSTANCKGISHLACFPADVPAFPANVVRHLAQALTENSASVAYINHRGQIQPLFSLWRLDLLDRVEEAITSGIYGPKLLFKSLDAVQVISDDKSPGAFCNINSASDLHAATLLFGNSSLDL